MKLITIIIRAAKSKYLVNRSSITRLGVLLLFSAICLLLFYTSKNSLPRINKEQLHKISIKQNCQRISGGLTVSLLNVGQGDAILISCPDRKSYTLIDGGDCSNNYPEAEEMFQRELFSRLGLQKGSLEYIINTHSHPDHICGLTRLIGKGYYPKTAYIDNGIILEPEDLASSIYGKLKMHNISHIIPLRDEISSIALCTNEPAIKLHFFPSYGNGSLSSHCQKDFNSCSLVTLLEYGSFRMLLQADVSAEWEKAALKDEKFKQFLPVTALKLGHHGSAISTTAEYLKHLEPSIAVISVGTPGHGKTDFGGYANNLTVKKVHRQLLKNQPVSNNNFHKVNTCKYDGKECSWKKRNVHPFLLSTAQGSIDIKATESLVCLQQ